MSPIDDKPRDTRAWGTAAVATGAALAGLAIYNRGRTKRAERRHPPLGRFVDVDGVAVHLVEQGSGPDLVLIHGNGVSLADWRASGQLERLARTYRVIAIDRPGYGYTDRPRTTIWTPAAQAALIAKLLPRLGVDRPIVVGHSFGTMVAAELALRDDVALGGLLLLSGYYYPSLRFDVALGAPPAIPGIGDVLRHTVSPIVGAVTFRPVAKGLFEPAELDNRFVGANRDLALRPSQIRAEAADAALMVPAAASLSKRVGGLPLPLSIAGGSGDMLVDTTDESERLHRDVPGSRFRRIEGAGHMVYWSHGDEVVEMIAELTRA